MSTIVPFPSKTHLPPQLMALKPFADEVTEVVHRYVRGGGTFDGVELVFESLLIALKDKFDDGTYPPKPTNPPAA